MNTSAAYLQIETHENRWKL